MTKRVDVAVRDARADFLRDSHIYGSGDGLVIRIPSEQIDGAHQNLDLIVAQARRLEIQVIAEGIETESQRHLCRGAV